VGGSGNLLFLLRKRPPNGLLAGLWEFPSVEAGEIIKGAKGGDPPPELKPRLSEMKANLKMRSTPEHADPALPLPPVPHPFSHLKAVYWPFLVQVEGGGEEDGHWTSLKEMEDLPLPVAQGKILRLALDALEPSDP
jgi:A/G-specific adenine glycosylase